jgi:peroxiredoxin
MNFIKSLFIALAPVVLISTAFNGYTLIANQNLLMGLSLLLTSMPLLMFLAYILLFKSLARTGKHLWPVQTPALLGVILCCLTVSAEFIPLLLFAGLSYLSTMLYIYWYSNNRRNVSQPLAEGNHLPSFVIHNHRGEVIDSTTQENHPMILMFTRGNWCPLCMAQIQEVADAYKMLEKAGVKVMIVASQPEKQTQNLAKKFAVPLQFLLDKNQQLGKQLGLIHHHGLPFGFQAMGHQSDQYYPTVIATDADGKIIYADQTSNYRVRPEPTELIKLYQ